MTATTRSEFPSVSEPTLYVAFELSKKSWKLAMTPGFAGTPWLRTVGAGELSAVARELARGRQHFRLPASAAVVSCYEAGRDGFWIHRALTAMAVQNRVVDSSSIEVNRRKRRTKTDRIDATKLVMMLVRVYYGEPNVWREVRVPSEATEAARHVSRERTALTKEQTRLTNQIGSVLATYGCRVPMGARQAADWWTQVRDWRNTPLPAPVQAEIARAEARLALVRTQLGALAAQQNAAVQAAPADSPLRRLVQLKGIATTGASVLIDEGLVWRAFQNRREIGGLLGFAPAKYESGDSSHDLGISRAGNARLQAVSLQLAWNWVRWQPLSPLTQWYWARFGKGKRSRRIGIVAVARKLVIVLWRYVTTGVVPAGAILKGLARA